MDPRVDPMVMDKSWMYSDRTKPYYRDGVDAFIKFATHTYEQDIASGKRKPYSEGKVKFLCPCVKCLNVYVHKARNVKLHLCIYGFIRNYAVWTEHGEGKESSWWTPLDVNGSDGPHSDEPAHAAETTRMVNALAGEKYSKESEKMQRILDDAQKPLYEGCEDFTKISAMCNLFNLKSKHGASDKFFNELLPLIQSMLPPGNEMMKSTYEAKKVMRDLGSGYEKIHVCINDCILYRKNYKDAVKCPTCGESRWKVDDITQEVHEKIPAKVLWYFPIIPRLKRLFQSKRIVEYLLWHSVRNIEEGVLKHPADSPAWKNIDKRYPEIRDDPRNLRLGISADGVDVNKGMQKQHSVWPILTVIYNLPPELCMKRKFTMLSLIIDGGPCNDIDVMLEPFVEDLKKLFEGVECFDAMKQEMFTLRAVVLWTINDYPALGTLCGCRYQGGYACKVCGTNTYSVRLKHCRKSVYTGHRRYLPYKHAFRSQKGFNGKEEHEMAPEPMNPTEIYNEVKSIENKWGKGPKNIVVEFVQDNPGRGGKMKRIEKTIEPVKDKSKEKETVKRYWKKFNIWFRLLPYWRYHVVHHCIDFMHVEKNVCESIVGTLLNSEFKSKDHLAARMDLKEMGFREELQPRENGKGGYTLKAACHTLSPDEKKMFCETLSQIKVPQGYCSNFSTLVNRKDKKLIGLKSHDYHILMQHFLPIAIKSIMPQPTRYAIIRFCFFFRAISSKEIKVAELEKLQSELVVTLCLLEKYFPPSFFDIMVHLTVHLTREVQMCGPVFFRWMYPFERCMKVIKGHVRNRNKPGGSIAEGNIAEETIEVIYEHQQSMNDTVGIPADRFNTSDTGEDSYHFMGKPISKAKFPLVDKELFDKAHFYVLQNSPEVEPYIERHKDYLKKKYLGMKNRHLDQKHRKEFAKWLQEVVAREWEDSMEDFNQDLRWLSNPPDPQVMTYESYHINGYLFRTESHDGCVNQNSGVYVQALDTHIRKSGITVNDAGYYGVLQEIWVLRYHALKMPLFRCKWVPKQGVSKDALGYILVELDKLGLEDDPFIVASQAQQVFYVPDQENKKKSIVLGVPTQSWKYAAGDEADEEFSMAVLCRNEYKCPKVDQLDLQKESRDDYYRDDIKGRTAKKAQAPAPTAVPASQKTAPAPAPASKQPSQRTKRAKP